MVFSQAVSFSVTASDPSNSDCAAAAAKFRDDSPTEVFTIGTEQIYKTTFGWRIYDQSDSDYCEINNDSFIANYVAPDEDLGAMDPEILLLMVGSSATGRTYPSGFNSL